MYNIWDKPFWLLHVLVVECNNNDISCKDEEKTLVTTRANLPYLNWAVIGDVENTMFKVSQLSHYIKYWNNIYRQFAHPFMTITVKATLLKRLIFDTILRFSIWIMKEFFKKSSCLN